MPKWPYMEEGFIGCIKVVVASLKLESTAP